MERLRRLRWITIALALWMSATVLAASLSPLFSDRSASSLMALCTSAGMKMVSVDALQGGSDSHAEKTLDCPSCLGSLLCMPGPASLALDVHFVSSPQTVLISAAFASRETLTASARGPPVSL